MDKAASPGAGETHPVGLVQVTDCCALSQELGVAQDLKVAFWVAVGAQNLCRQGKGNRPWLRNSPEERKLCHASARTPHVESHCCPLPTAPC